MENDAKAYGFNKWKLSSQTVSSPINLIYKPLLSRSTVTPLRILKELCHTAEITIILNPLISSYSKTKKYLLLTGGIV